MKYYYIYIYIIHIYNICTWYLILYIFIQIDRQIDRQVGRQVGSQVGSQIDRQIDIHIYIYLYKQYPGYQYSVLQMLQLAILLYSTINYYNYISLYNYHIVQLASVHSTIDGLDLRIGTKKSIILLFLHYCFSYSTIFLVGQQ